MKVEFVILVLGSLVIILGTIFHFQGKSMIGPESSFMYANPDWVLHRIEIIGAGIIIIGISLAVIIKKRKESRKAT